MAGCDFHLAFNFFRMAAIFTASADGRKAAGIGAGGGADFPALGALACNTRDRPQMSHIGVGGDRSEHTKSANLYPVKPGHAATRRQSRPDRLAW